MVSAFQGRVFKGEIRLEENVTLPEGARVIVVLPDDPMERGITGAELLASGFVGIWADRDDIGDTAEFAEKLRREAEKRTPDA